MTKREIVRSLMLSENYWTLSLLQRLALLVYAQNLLK